LPVKKKQCAHYFIDLKFTRGILVVWPQYWTGLTFFPI
jgi:hypothetical protein